MSRPVRLALQAPTVGALAKGRMAPIIWVLLSDGWFAVHIFIWRAAQELFKKCSCEACPRLEL